jgi:ankyrin repeat protein
VRILIDSGANIEKGGNNGTTPRMSASSHGHLETVKLLIEMGSRVNAEDEDGDTALAYASIRGAPEGVLNELVTAGADVKHQDRRGKTPEMLAAENGHAELVVKLKEMARHRVK